MRHSFDPDNERSLFSSIAKGDEAAFDKLFFSVLPQLLPFVLKLVKSRSSAQEVIQEIFIRVWINREKLVDIEHPRRWLFTVALNECYSWLRKSALENKLLRSLSTVKIAEDPVSEHIEARDMNRIIEDAINKLPPQRRLIYTMSRKGYKKIPEIADELNLSPHTVNNALVASLKFIRRHLAEAGILLFLLITGR